jgi:DNA polymerase I-like protein with 3'-5' exonuclease and polymerase domains
MPYHCINEQGVEFDFRNPAHIRAWDQVWFLKEDPTIRWTPTDVHSETAKAAFDITENDPHFKEYRSKAKTVNFGKNYGAQLRRIKSMFPEYSEERCRKINEAYYLVYPGIKLYHNYCYSRAIYASTSNLFGIKYYNASGHNLINLLVQGSAAYFLKLKIIELYHYSKQHNIKSRWQMQIHDELSWEHHIDDPPEIFLNSKELWKIGPIH